MQIWIEENILKLLFSFMKEMTKEEERNINPGAVRHQLFVDEQAIQPVNEIVFDDDDERWRIISGRGFMDRNMLEKTK